MRLIEPTSHHRIPIVEIEFYELEKQGLSADKIIAFARTGRAIQRNRHGDVDGEYFAIWFPNDHFPRLYNKDEVEFAVDAFN